MVVVTILRGSQGEIAGFEARGHAGFARRGSDVVCAGVSALTQAAVLGLARRVGVALEVEQRQSFLRCRVVGGVDGAPWERVGDVLETMLLGLREIAARYPGHVRLEETSLGEAAGGGDANHVRRPNT